ncbi:patatin-like phospholipase family protein [Pedobacter ginsengiterrae]|uniref:Patatin-like phospholipase family protein n=1 Tax=Pedobacter ginsengiterrae TaxID=871696 RepID=A0ABP7PWC1_9SPHI
MDIITDLSARVASFFSVYEELCLKLGLPGNFDGFNIRVNNENIQKLNRVDGKEELNTRVLELYFNRNFPHSPAKTLFSTVLELWKFNEKFSKREYFETLNDVRENFRKILYDSAECRIELCTIIEYMPIQIILALDSDVKTPLLRRLYQVWGAGIANLAEPGNYNLWWEGKKGTAASFLIRLEDLKLKLLEHKEPLPFDSFFSAELEEIKASRKARGNPSVDDSNFKDPYLIAKKLSLSAIAFSGGGIRSATFNLGVLQKLGELDVLKKFDYISTVSGGGYIGSWLISWIKRAGCVSAVSNLLNTFKSSNPLAEEVRPVRWLRMYSNYLAPTTGLFSIDSLTMGLTWLRNTLINQFLLVLLLCSVLSLISFIFELWSIKNVPAHCWDSLIVMITCAVAALVAGVVLISEGMRIYANKTTIGKLKYYFEQKNIPLYLGIWSGVVALFFSSWMWSNSYFQTESFDWAWPLFGGFVVLIYGAKVLIAERGKYINKTLPKEEQEEIAFWLHVSSFISAALACYLLRVSWNLILNFDENWPGVSLLSRKLAFILGPPLIIESIVISVIVRMSIMGILFQDERREWWGRMGAVVHRIMLVWMVLTFGALVLPELLADLYVQHAPAIPALLGGWGAIIAWAVRLAFNARTESNASASRLSVSEIFVRFAPYLFMIGFLMIGSWVFNLIRSSFEIPFHNQDSHLIPYLVLTLILAGVSLELSKRIGINEFSLFHFYRNRLTRAYLGATRRREDRENSANGFTSFDKADDIKLSAFLAENDYVGPYPILNTSMNASTVSELDRQDRKAESFIFSPKFCGYDFSTLRSAAGTKNGVFQYGYQPTEIYSEKDGPTLGTAMSISGAAVNPNMGYHSSAPTAFLLTLFNVRLGKWIGNPRMKSFGKSDPESGLAYLIYDLVGKSDINKEFVALSDGGHFDNMGIYELIRRGCRDILLCDAEEDTLGTCEGLANAIRRCRIDFGVEIELKLDALTEKKKDSSFVGVHRIKGTIRYPGERNPSGKIIYIKASLTGNESVDIREYWMKNSKFPQQSTSDQFFNEAQFESYRNLGYHSIRDKNDLN